MQATCTQCGNKLAIDDAKVPDRPFSVKCPKCQTLVKLSGRGAAPAEGAPTPASGIGTEEMKAQVMAQLRREMGSSEVSAGRALVVLPDKGLAGALTLVLTRQGYSVDTLDEAEEGARLLEQGVYDLVATVRVAGAAGKGESLYQRINRMSPDARRRIFVVLAGDEFKSGDATQAFAVLADLVLSSRDVASADALVRSTLAERARLYQAFLDARRRHEAASV